MFAVANWWEYLSPGKTRGDEAGELEEQQGINNARAAAQKSILRHYI